MHRSFLLLALAFSIAATPALAQSEEGPELRSRHEDWTVFLRDLGEDLVCYAASAPVDAAPQSGDHDDVRFMVATWRSGASTDQPSLWTGYQLRLDAPTTARVGSDRFPMFAHDQHFGYAYVLEDEDQPRLVRAMKRGYSMRVETVTHEGTQTTYEFSLRGVTAAIDAANAACR